MKKILFGVIAIFTVQFVSAQVEFSRDRNGSKTAVGFLEREHLTTDTAFSWFNTNIKMFTPDQNSVNGFKANKDSVNIIIFGGTWCDDTKQVLPQFFALADAAGFPADRVTMLGVDRDKKTIHHLSEAFNITNVPTFIIMKNGKEIGRVIEYGKTGLPVKEVAEIAAKR